MSTRAILIASSLALVSAIASVAHAADQRFPPPVYAAPVVQPQAGPRPFDWGRCYGGVQAGNKIVDNRIDLSRTDWFVAEQITKSTVTMTGPVVGAQVGCNALLQEGLLIGFEVEGLWGKKNQNGCGSQVDPVSYCIDRFKEKEAFATIRIGYVVDNAFLCQCLNGLMIYGRAGAGYTHTDLKMNVNVLSYYQHAYKADPNDPNGAILYKPQYAQNYDLTGSKTFISPVLGFGVERAINENWTVRMDFSSMLSISPAATMTVSKIKYLGPAPLGEGDTLPADATGLVRNPSRGDLLPIKIREVETKLTFGLNRLF